MRRLLLFAHFHRPGRIAPWALEHLAALRPYVDRAVLLSTSSLPADRRAIDAVVDDAVELPNLGFDFGMWQAGLRRESLHDIDELWLVNSSVVGPLTPLSAALERVADPGIDFWSMTENWGPVRHLQSWFLGVRKPVLQSEAFRQFFDSILPFREKWAIITANEVGFTAWLTQHGFVGAAAWPFPEVQAAIGPVRHLFPVANPTTTFAADLLALGMPYVKVEVLRGIIPPNAPLSHRLLPLHAARLRRALAARGLVIDVSDAIL